MALRRPAQEVQPAAAAATMTATAGAFEEMDEEVVTRPAANDSAPPKPAAAAPAAAAPRSTAVAAPRNTAVSTAFATRTILDELQNQLGLDELESMGFGAFPRVTVYEGGFKLDKTKMLGDKVVVDILSWNLSWLVTTGEQDNPEANKLIRSSYDGVNLLNGAGTIADYVQQLKIDGYSKTSVKRYIELYANIISTAKFGDVAPENQEIVQVSVSPQSVSQWQRFLLDSRMKSLKGVEITSTVTMTSESKTLNAKAFGIINFSRG